MLLVTYRITANLENANETEKRVLVQQTQSCTAGEWKVGCLWNASHLKAVMNQLQQIPSNSVLPRVLCQSALTFAYYQVLCIVVNVNTTGWEPLGMCCYASFIALTRTHTRTGLGRAFLPRSEHSVLCLLFRELKGSKWMLAQLWVGLVVIVTSQWRERKHCHLDFKWETQTIKGTF